MRLTWKLCSFIPHAIALRGRQMGLGDFSQCVMQVIDVAVIVVFGFVMAYVWCKISDLITPVRVSRETAIEGLDGPERGVLGYPDFQLHPSASGQQTMR